VERTSFSPAVGFNNNVRHRDRTFHIQTEDSGVLRPHIHTHLFADGGRVIKSIRRDYADKLHSPELKSVVVQMMKAQHQAMFRALVAGKLDAIIDRLDLEGTTPPPVPELTRIQPSQLSLPLPEPVPVLDDSGIPLSLSPLSLAAHLSAQVAEPPHQPPNSAPYPSSRRGRPALHDVAPSGGSIFGSPTAREQSLDDVIQSYLETPEGEPAAK
jgi:hypothetical protein